MIKFLYLAACKVTLLRYFFVNIKKIYYKIKNIREISIKKECSLNILYDISKNKYIANYKANKYIKNLFNKKIIIKGYYKVISNATTDFASCKVVLLAHSDPHNIIDPYVIYQVKHLKKIGKKIIICSSNILNSIYNGDELFDAVVYRTCNGNFFTSWKACLDAFPSLYKSEELTLCNDTVFSPLNSYNYIYRVMNNIKCDFWGITYSYSREKIPHLHSYHLVCKKNTLSNYSFKEFFDSIPLDGDQETTIKYEVAFSLWLELHGLKGGCYRKITSKKNLDLYPTAMLSHGIPVIKRDLFKFSTFIYWQNELEKFDYPISLIMNYFYRIGIDISTSLCPGLRSGMWPPSVFNCQKKYLLNSKKCKKKLNIAIILHCYYTDTLYKIIRYLEILPKEFHLLISTDTEEKLNIIKAIISDLKFEKKIIRVVPNKGWDIGPFFNAFNDIIFDYDLICKLHAKTSTNLPASKSQQWRDIIFDSLIGDKERVADIIFLFSNNYELGMLVPPTPPFVSVDFAYNYNMCKKILNSMQINISEKEAIDFPVGAMFWARPQSLKPLFDLDFNFNKFTNTNTSYRDGTLAHAIERCFVFSCCASGFKWCRIAPMPYRNILKDAHNLYDSE